MYYNAKDQLSGIEWPAVIRAAETCERHLRVKRREHMGRKR